MRRRRCNDDVEARRVSRMISIATCRRSSSPRSGMSAVLPSILSLIATSYWGCPCAFRFSTMRWISPSVVNVPWARIRCLRPGFRYSMSPLPSSLSAPIESRIVRLSFACATWNAIRAGKLALIVPVMTFTDGRCVARIMWMPTARDNCASRAIWFSISACATSMRSASSSTTITMYGTRSGTLSSSSSSSGGGASSVPAKSSSCLTIGRLLNDSMFRTPARANIL